MIRQIRGKLSTIDETRALVDNCGISYEVLLPSALAGRLRGGPEVGEEITFETIYYIEAGDRKSSHYPRLVGFDDAFDREFFSLYLQVPGLGVKKALKSLVIPIREIATAIETKDAARLNRLPGVGARLAEKIIAELHGKTAKFALSRKDEPLAKPTAPAPPFAEEATEVLMQLQYKANEAQLMIEKALEDNPKIKSAEELISTIFKSQHMAEEEGR